MKRALVPLFVAALSLAWAGCGGNSQSAHDPKAASASHDEHGDHDHGTRAGHSHDAAPQKPVIADTASPEEVVELFLDSVRGGDDEIAALLLTDVARAETENAGLVVQTPGTPGAEYEVGQAEYPTSDGSGAHVKSMWTEFDENDEAITWEVIWILRKQAEGWRIAGMATQTEEEGPYQFLNFEQPEEMLKLLQAAQSAAERQPGNESDESEKAGSPNEALQATRVGASGDDTAPSQRR